MILQETKKGRTQKSQVTSGLAEIIKIYDSDYQEIITRNESPEGKSYF